VNCAFASFKHLIGLMLEGWIIISGAAFSKFLYFVLLQSNMTIQLRINMLWQMAEA